MSIRYKYQFDKKGKKKICTGCGQRRLVGYINMETNEYLPDHVGRCDRENSCGYFYTAQQYFKDNNIINNTETERFRFHAPKGMETGNAKPIDFLPFELMYTSLNSAHRSNLYPFLEKLFRETVATELCHKYMVGANRDGNATYWKVDKDGNIRQAKVIPYKIDGHRDKEKIIKQYIKDGELRQIRGAYAAGKEILKKKDANLQECFFGEHLLSLKENLSKTVALCESEKTSLIASVYYPQFVWLATGGKTGCKWTEEKVCKALAGRKVVLFPDLGAYDSWNEKSKLLASVGQCKVVVSDYLEKVANEEDKKGGYDIADFLLRKQDSTGLALTDYEYPIILDY